MTIVEIRIRKLKSQTNKRIDNRGMEIEVSVKSKKFSFEIQILFSYTVV